MGLTPMKRVTELPTVYHDCKGRVEAEDAGRFIVDVHYFGDPAVFHGSLNAGITGSDDSEVRRGRCSTLFQIARVFIGRSLDRGLDVGVKSSVDRTGYGGAPGHEDGAGEKEGNEEVGSKSLVHGIVGLKSKNAKSKGTAVGHIRNRWAKTGCTVVQMHP